MQAFKSILIVLCFSFFFLSSTVLHAQMDVSWDDLGQVDYLETEDPETGFTEKFPVFKSSIFELDGQDISLTGYLLPIDMEGKSYFLSKYPYSACFFCSPTGEVGAETIVELNLDKTYPYLQLDDIVQFRGTLMLSDANGEDIFYILENAQLVSSW